MRIAMLCSNHAVSDARITYKQAASLAQMGHQVCVMGLGTDWPAEVPGVEFEVASPFRNGIVARATIAPKLLAPALRWKPDAVTCHEPETAALGLLIRARCGARVVFDVHELWHETMAARAPAPARGVARWGFAKSLQTIARRCDWVTVVSPWNQVFYGRVRRDGRVTLIHNSPRVEWFPPCRQPRGGTLVLVHEGGLNTGRGMFEMLEALAEARRRVDVRWLIIGGVRGDEARQFNARMAELTIRDVVESSGWVP